jgi:hypothetical protein
VPLAQCVFGFRPPADCLPHMPMSGSCVPAYLYAGPYVGNGAGTCLFSPVIQVAELSVCCEWVVLALPSGTLHSHVDRFGVCVVGPSCDRA